MLTYIVALSYICLPSKRASSGYLRSPKGNCIRTTLSMRNTGTVLLFPVPILDKPCPLSRRPIPQRSLQLVTWEYFLKKSGKSIRTSLIFICISSFGGGFNWGKVKLGITCKVIQEEESSSLVLCLLSLDLQT